MTAATIPPGTLIDNRYRIQRVLGQGGFGRTYLVTDERRFGEACVLKEFIATGGGDCVIVQKLRELFRREATILHKLNHPQIPKFFAWFEKRERLFIVQEYVNGKTYWQLLQDRLIQGEVFSTTEVAQLLWHLLRVLAYIHGQNIVHRDISPDNIMLPKGRNLPVLIDFGVVKQATTQLQGLTPHLEDDLIQASVAVGKFGYSPAEQMRMGQCSPRSDLYSLGVTAVVLLTGKRPNLLVDPRSLEWKWRDEVNINRSFADILDKMMAEKPQDRYPSAEAVLTDLQRLSRSALRGDRASAKSGAFATRSTRQSRSAAKAQVHAGALGGSPQTVIEPIATVSEGQTRRSKGSLAAKSEALLPTVAETRVEPIDPSMFGDIHRAVTAVLPPLPRRVGQAIALLPFSHLAPVRDGLAPSAKSPLPLLPAANSAPSTRIHVHVQPRLKRSQQILWQLIAFGSLLLLPMGGALVGIQSPYIATLCQTFKNCAKDQEFSERYRQAQENATAAIILAENAQTIAELQSARDRLQDAIAQLETIPTDTTPYAEAQQIVSNHQVFLSNLEEQLTQEETAANLLDEAETAARAATELTKVAKAPQDFQAAREHWQTAIDALQQVPDETFVDLLVERRRQEYAAKVEAMDRLIAAETEVQPNTGTSASGTRDVASPISPQPASTTRNAGSSSFSKPISSPQSSARPSPSTASSSNPSPQSRSSAPVASSSAPMRSSAVAAAPRPATNPVRPSNTGFVGSVTLNSAQQTLNQVSVRLSAARVSPSGNFIADLVIDNQSDRVFTFVPLFAEVRNASGQAVQSRILFNRSDDIVARPGGRLSGQLYVMNQNWNQTSPQNLVLVIPEGTTGGRVFRIPF